MSIINDPRKLKKYFKRYNKAIKLLAEKNTSQLIELDEWLWNDLKNDVYERYEENGYYLTKMELSNIMKWKLIRGKFRPLQHLVDSNSEDYVKECTSKALNILCNAEYGSNAKWKEALKILMLLKGIGIATASIILSIFSPQYCPFMSDEVIAEFCSCKNPYTVSVYNKIQLKIVEVIDLLNIDSEIVWNAEMVGKALWSYEILKK